MDSKLRSTWSGRRVFLSLHRFVPSCSRFLRVHIFVPGMLDFAYVNGFAGRTRSRIFSMSGVICSFAECTQRGTGRRRERCHSHVTRSCPRQWLPEGKPASLVRWSAATRLLSFTECYSFRLNCLATIFIVVNS